MPDPNEEARLETVRQRLRRSPKLEEAVRRAIADGRFPALPPVATESVARGDALESVMSVGPLEAIVRRVGRPPMLVRNGVVELEELPEFPPETDTKIRKAERFVASVGRVEFLNFAMAWGGTGWVIGADGSDRLVATNRHVAKLVARRTPDGRGAFLRSERSGLLLGANLDFDEEIGAVPAEARPFEVTDVVYLADDTAPDIAVLRITGDDLPQPLPLAEDGPAEEGELVAIVGYPAFDSRNPADAQAFYFGDTFEVKRFAPGKITAPLTRRTALTHDCTTLGGNSGSPLVSLDRSQVVGLHFAGEFEEENFAVGGATLLELVESGFRPHAVPVSAAAAAATEAADGTHGAGDLVDRPGYDPAFLGKSFPTPWPGLPVAVEADLARPTDELEGRLGELRYTHFGVRFSRSRRQPLMTAVTIDGAHLVSIKRTNDRWFRDGRIDAALQLGQADYADPKIDRGHLVRRQDPNWDPAAKPGKATPLATRANADTFHYTNAAPQHSEMNQGSTLWLGLEDLVLESARTNGFKACVFTGPIVGPNDPEIAEGVVAPLEFWKLVAMVDADRKRLHATAYLLSQGDLIRRLLERRGTEANEGFVLGPYRTFQIAVRDLATATGYDFSAYTAADPLGTGDESAGPRFVPLDRAADLVL